MFPVIGGRGHENPTLVISCLTGLSEVCRRHTLTAEGRLPVPELLETFVTEELR